jgi:putative membrane protein
VERQIVSALLVAGVIVVLVAVLAPVLIMWTMMGMMGMGGMMGDMMGDGTAPQMMPGAGWMMLFPVLVVVGVVLVAAWGARRILADDRRGDDAPLAIVQRRYANGEIDREEYERIRGDLTRDRALR